MNAHQRRKVWRQWRRAVARLPFHIDRSTYDLWKSGGLVASEPQPLTLERLRSMMEPRT